ncbi:PadR family transcriptional regulator [Rathayibacter sp. VKM Ac-2760]|uniref:PadR family transcriptional regulator n=1 Tax=Rathayibacter sp. VKM Ac-2760 TaxID=2609253 RepID=UPI001FC9076A|nr:PadR family transcriptional regulator [Rathayibacter sp. VKM Ac-2760]
MEEIREPRLWIMTVLARGRTHGYGIIAAAQELSDGAMVLKIPTLYSALDRLERQGLIAADGEEEVDGRRRRYFRLTDAGAARLAADAERLAQMERAAASAVRRLGRSATA